ncbi:MAG: hypothetical protein R3B06_08550 [Kofleriaceae bacterium]
MKHVALAFTLGALLIGCGGSAADEAMAKMKTARDKACACKDYACASKARDEFSDWMKANRDKLKGSEPSKSFQEKFKAIEKEARECSNKLRDAERGNGEPAPAAPPAE